VLRGEKTSTSSLRQHYRPHTDEELPQVGERLAMLDFDDRPVAVIEVTEVRVIPAGEVDLQFARDEGEGFETVAAWRSAHEPFWAPVIVSDATLVVAQRFRLVEHGNPQEIAVVRTHC
jgi:uncharacterized protein YhfF